MIEFEPVSFGQHGADPVLARSKDPTHGVPSETRHASPTVSVCVPIELQRAMSNWTSVGPQKHVSHNQNLVNGRGSKPIGSHFGVRCTAHFRTYFSGDWDVHSRYEILTHGQMDPEPCFKNYRGLWQGDPLLPFIYPTRF